MSELPMASPLARVADATKAMVKNSTVVMVAATLLLVLATTRLLSGRTKSKSGTVDTPSMPTYWIPFFGHGFQMIANMDDFLVDVLKRYPEGIFSLNLFGTDHSFLARPSLVTKLMNQPESIASIDWMHEKLTGAVFGWRKEYGKDLFKKSTETYHSLNSAQSLAKMTASTVKTLNETLSDWVTFNSQPADQTEWEQVAEADVVDDGNAVEVELLELTRNFVARVASPSMFGTDFVDNFPDFAQYLWLVDRHFNLLAAGLPAWIPYRPLQLARAARGKLLQYMEEFHIAMEKHANGEEPDARWENLENVSQFVMDRLDLFRKEGTCIRGRAALDLGNLWAMNANSAPLVFWMIYEISRDRVLLEQIREEISPFVDVVQPKNDFGLAVWMAPEIRTLDVDGLMDKCPLLKAAYVETLRLYTAGYTIKWMEKDACLGKPSDEHGAYLLKKGTYAHGAHAMHNLDPLSYPDPHEWQPARHLKESVDGNGNKRQTADFGTIRPYGGGSHMCKGRAYASRELMVFTAAILSMYDVGPAEGESWGALKTVKGTVAKSPARPVKAWIRRRKVRNEGDVEVET